MRRELASSLERPRITKAAFESLLEIRDRARAALARTVSAPPEQLALTSSTTQGIGLVVAGIEWSAGDEVITTTEEHQGLLSPLDVIARRHGVVVRAVPAEQIASAVGDPPRWWRSRTCCGRPAACSSWSALAEAATPPARCCWRRRPVGWARSLWTLRPAARTSMRSRARSGCSARRAAVACGCAGAESIGCGRPPPAT